MVGLARFSLYCYLSLIIRLTFNEKNIISVAIAISNISLLCINGIEDSLKLKEVEGVSNQYGEVYYKKLTNTPVFLVLFKKG